MTLRRAALFAFTTSLLLRSAHYRVYSAGGNGGQIVMVIPDLDLVVGFTGGAYGKFPKWYKWQTELVPQFIIPAAISTIQR